MVQKIQIGSIHGKVNYGNKEQVFHPADIPTHIHERVKEVKVFKSRQIFKELHGSNYCAPWNISTSTSKPENTKLIPQKISQKKLRRNFSLTSTTMSSVSHTENDFIRSSSDAQIRWDTTELRDICAYQTTCQTQNIEPWNYSNVFKGGNGQQIKSKQKNLPNYMYVISLLCLYRSISILLFVFCFLVDHTNVKNYA